MTRSVSRAAAAGRVQGPEPRCRFPLDVATIEAWVAEQRRRRDSFSASLSSYRTAAVGEEACTTGPVVTEPAAVAGSSASNPEGISLDALPGQVMNIFTINKTWSLVKID